MALDFSGIPGASSSDEILPLLAYNAKSGRFSTVEKVETATGWQKQEAELSEADCVFVMDIGNAMKGWLLFKAGMAPVKRLVPYDTPDAGFPPRPEGDWGVDSLGKPILPRPGFVMHVLTKDNRKREFASNAAACIAGIGPVDRAYQAAAAERAAGKVPVVKLMRTVKVGKNGNYQPELEVVKWIDRPAALGGSAPAPVAQAAAPPKMATAEAIGDDLPF